MTIWRRSCKARPNSTLLFLRNRRRASDYFTHAKNCAIAKESTPVTQAILLEILAGVRAYFDTEIESAIPMRHEIRDAITFLHRNFQEKISLGDIQNAAKLSRSRFEYLFVKETGVSPVAYLARLRVFNTKRLMLEGKTVSEAADASGFDDPGRFSKVFRKCTGTSALIWRKDRAKSGH